MKGVSDVKCFGRENSIGFLNLKTTQVALSKICFLTIFAQNKSTPHLWRSYKHCVPRLAVFFAIPLSRPLFEKWRTQQVGTF